MLYRIQMIALPSDVKTLIAEISSGLSDVLQASLASSYPEHYETIKSIKLRFKPQVIYPPTPPLLKRLVIITGVILLGTVIVLGIVYRKQIAVNYNRIVNTYRERRRKNVYEEYGIMYNMYFLPKEGLGISGITTFETPYGDIHLTKPLITSEKKELPGFIQVKGESE